MLWGGGPRRRTLWGMTVPLPPSPPRHTLALTWLAAAIPTVLVALLVVGLSEQSEDRVAGWVLAALALSAVVLGGWLVSRRGRHTPPAVSLVLSAVWAVAAVALYPTQDFLADALLVCGVPLLVAVVTAVVAVRSRR